MNDKGFSLVEIMVVLLITSFVMGIIYEFITIGLRFFETFSKESNYSVRIFISDILAELNSSDNFFVEKNKKLSITKGETNITYYVLPPSKDFSTLPVKKETKYKTTKAEKIFYLTKVIDVNFLEKSKDNKRKVFVSILSTKGKEIFSGYLP
jgi:prepilin-type N-terminal cleavage/methylation domain-containing protein